MDGMVAENVACWASVALNGSAAREISV